MRARSLRRVAAAALAVVLALAGCATLDEQQRKWVFQPSKQSWRGASADGMQEVWISFDSREARAPVRLNALWLPQASDDAPVLLYLHGARWDVRSSTFRMRRMHELGFSVLGVDYRGFGRSTDTLPSETFAYEDARAAWDWLGRQHPRQARYNFGHSLGAAIAVELAADVHDESGLLVEGSFTSLADVIGSFRWGWLPLGPLITQRFDAASRIAAVGSPVLVVHGSADSLIVPALGQALYEQALPPKQFVLVDGGSHHNTNSLGQAQYRAAIHELFGIGMAGDVSGAGVATR